MLFDTVVVGALGVNCYILGCEETRQAVVVDPGDESEKILSRVKRHNLTPVAIINTHGHFDHVGGNSQIILATGAKLHIHPADAAMLGDVARIARMYGLHGENSPPPDTLLEDNTLINFGNLKIKIVHTPGHTAGGCCLYIEEKNMLISGDTLFADSIGRTDLPGGSFTQLLKSIKEKLFLLPEQVQVHPGHGSVTTIGHEKRHNPYME